MTEPLAGRVALGWEGLRLILGFVSRGAHPGSCCLAPDELRCL